MKTILVKIIAIIKVLIPWVKFGIREYKEFMISFKKERDTHKRIKKENKLNKKLK